MEKLKISMFVVLINALLGLNVWAFGLWNNSEQWILNYEFDNYTTKELIITFITNDAPLEWKLSNGMQIKSEANSIEYPTITNENYVSYSISWGNKKIKKSDQEVPQKIASGPLQLSILKQHLPLKNLFLLDQEGRLIMKRIDENDQPEYMAFLEITYDEGLKEINFKFYAYDFHREIYDAYMKKTYELRKKEE